jgi:hypothetical protein
MPDYRRDQDDSQVQAIIDVIISRQMLGILLTGQVPQARRRQSDSCGFVYHIPGNLIGFMFLA